MAGAEVSSMKDRQIVMKSFCSSPPPNLECDAKLLKTFEQRSDTIWLTF